MKSEFETILTGHGVKVTANRILILRALHNASGPLSMTELETELETIDKSIISRTLATFREHRLVHRILSGGEAKYELCHGHMHTEVEMDDDEHVHFYCEECHRTFCLDDIRIPEVKLPVGYHPSEITYLVSGICRECSRKSQL